ncbi:Thioredoxin domain-containing protein [Sphingomonas antarctica]|uniref:protein-disulfide reductase DsbD family protein n=1 Tax=Sphingomonas antarctica TaxID=2040274 RepID=UPI0039EBF405
MRLSRLLMLLFLCIAAPAAARNMDGVLVAETMHPRAGQEVAVALVLTPHPGWHGYWSNPGEAGFPPQFKWTLPADTLVAGPDFPVPHVLSVAGLANYVFEGEHALLFRLKVPRSLASGRAIPLKLSAHYLVCSAEVCVPEAAEFALTLTAGDGTDRDPRFDAWRARLPAPLAAEAHFSHEQPLIRFAIPYPANAALTDPRIYPIGRKAIIDSSPQAVTRVGDTLVVSLSAAPNFSQASIAGVLAIGGGRGLSFTAVPGPVPAVPPPAPRADARATIIALLGAILGGLILNIMPCVFPILSLKALSLAKSGADERAARREALAYAAGAILVLTALGGLVIALKVGWAFQLQDPRVVLILFALMVALTLNLLGVFELPVLGGGTHPAGGFATGALAAFVATPCTGPFMGAALGAALILPPAAALAVFAGLGFGLALPFLAIGFIPALRRKLPRPGQWMVTLRRVLAVPMALTALWLGWVFSRQTGSTGLALMLGVVAVVTVALFFGGRRQHVGRAGIAIAAAIAVVGTIAAAGLVRPKARNAISATADSPATGEKFSEARLAQLVAAKKPVFVYFTADWCLTCKVNEKAAIDREETQAAFKKAGVTTLVGDWTDGDATIGAFLRAHGRAGVPLYLYYAPGEANARELPQILTPETLIRQTGS